MFLLRFATGIALVTTLSSCSLWPAQHDHAGRAERHPLIAPQRPLDAAVSHGDWLFQRLEGADRALDILVLEGAKACLPAHVVRLRQLSIRSHRELIGRLQPDAAIDLRRLQAGIHQLRQHLYALLSDLDCHPDQTTVATVVAHRDAVATAPTKPPAATDQPAGWLHELQHLLNAHNLFPHDSADLNPWFAASLRQAAPVLQQHPEVMLHITGYTDATGTAAYNQALSKRRAARVRDALIQAGVAAARISVAGAGISTYSANATPEQRLANRHSQISLTLPHTPLSAMQDATPRRQSRPAFSAP